MKRHLVSSETVREEVIADLKRLMINHKVPNGTLAQVAINHSTNYETVRTWWHRERHPGKRAQAWACTTPFPPSNHHQKAQGGVGSVSPDLSSTAALPMVSTGTIKTNDNLAGRDPGKDSELFFEQFIDAMGCPNVHDIHLAVRGVPAAWDRALTYGFSLIDAGNLTHYLKEIPERYCSIEVYHNGTIRLIIEASARGGLNAEEFNDLIFQVAQSEIYLLTMKALSLSDFEIVGDPHFNVDQNIMGWTPPFKSVTLKTITGVLLRAYLKKINSEEKLRIEAIGKPESARNILGVLRGAVNTVDRDMSYQQFIFMMMQEYRELVKKIESRFSPSPFPFPSSPSMSPPSAFSPVGMPTHPQPGSCVDPSSSPSAQPLISTSSPIPPTPRESSQSEAVSPGELGRRQGTGEPGLGPGASVDPGTPGSEPGNVETPQAASVKASIKAMLLEQYGIGNEPESNPAQQAPSNDRGIAAGPDDGSQGMKSSLPSEGGAVTAKQKELPEGPPVCPFATPWDRTRGIVGCSRNIIVKGDGMRLENCQLWDCCCTAAYEGCARYPELLKITRGFVT